MILFLSLPIPHVLSTYFLRPTNTLTTSHAFEIKSYTFFFQNIEIKSYTNSLVMIPFSYELPIAP